MINLLGYCLLMRRPEPPLLVLTLTSIRVWMLVGRLALFAIFAVIPGRRVIIHLHVNQVLLSILQINSHVLRILILFLPRHLSDNLIVYHLWIHWCSATGVGHVSLQSDGF